VTHTADAIAPGPYQLISDIDTIRTGSSVQSGVENHDHSQELQQKEEAHPFSNHNKFRIEISVTFNPLWIAFWVSFVGPAGIYACTIADSHRV